MDGTSTLLATGGGIALILTALAWAGDHRRRHRSRLDDVGFMPWTGLFVLSLFAAVILLGLAAQAWLVS